MAATETEAPTSGAVRTSDLFIAGEHVAARDGRSAPDDLRAELRKLKRPAQVAYCAQFRDRPSQDLEHRMTVRAMRSTAQHVQAPQAEAKELENEILTLVRQQAPELLDLLGVGPITAAQILVSWSHQGRFSSEPPSPPSPVSRRSLPRPG
jgi:transposase